MKVYFIYIFCIFQIILSVDVFLNPTEGIKDISYNSEDEKLTFSIPIDTSEASTVLQLKLSEPYKSNKDNCISTCNIISNLISCEILKSSCDLLTNSSTITVHSIISPSNYFFTRYDYLTSEIIFNVSDIEYVCSNYKLSFFLKCFNLNYHTYQNFEFNFSVFYKNSEEKAICVFPKNGNYFSCVIDASKILFKKKFSLFLDLYKPIQISKDLKLIINNFNKYKFEEDCGKDIDNSKEIININIIKYISFFIFLYI